MNWPKWRWLSIGLLCIAIASMFRPDGASFWWNIFHGAGYYIIGIWVEHYLGEPSAAKE